MSLKATVLLSILAVSGTVFAQTAPAAPDYTLSFNAGAVTDYRYRGISQSRLKPAVQAGADLGHSSGFYVGTWASSIRWIEDAGGDAKAEWDIYGGYKGSLAGVGYDVGVLRYQYPSHELAVSPNTTELYVAGSLGPATLKYSHATTNLFGFSDSENSYYVDLSATFDMGGGWSVVPHVGYQKVKNNDNFSYTDYSVAVAKDFGNGLSASLALVDTDAEGYTAPNGKDLGKAGAVLGVKYSF